jgi:hypothetical protein
MDNFDTIVDRIHAKAASKASDELAKKQEERNKLLASLAKAESDLRAKVNEWIATCIADGKKDPITFVQEIDSLELSLLNTSRLDAEVRGLMERVVASSAFRGKRYKVELRPDVTHVIARYITMKVTASIVDIPPPDEGPGGRHGYYDYEAH